MKGSNLNIGFLSMLNPFDINNWSGTLFHISNTLSKYYSVIWVGKDFLDPLSSYGFRTKSYLEYYAQVFGKILSERINKSDFDVIIVRDYFFGAFLNIEIPIIYVGDTTFRLFKENMKIPSPEFERIADCIEERMIENADCIIFSSDWAKKSAVNDYNCAENKIHIVEFGANIPTPLEYKIDVQTKICNLVFIGKEWKRKGCDKVINAYRLLKQSGFKCQLTIIGSTPERELDDDDDLIIIPHLDKSKKEDLDKLCGILENSHFLFLPTNFEPYGIVFCEASAYGVPSITADVGGVSQPVREGKNGFLLPPNATAEDYAEEIKSVFSDKESYIELRKSSRREYEIRINWDVWGEKVNKILKKTIKNYKKKW